MNFSPLYLSLSKTKCLKCNKKTKEEEEVVLNTINDTIELNCIPCFINSITSHQILEEFFKGTFNKEEFKEYYESYDFQNKVVLKLDYECHRCNSLLNSFKISSNFKFECNEKC